MLFCKGLFLVVVGWYSFDWYILNIYFFRSFMSYGFFVVVLFDEKGKIFVYLGRRGKMGFLMLNILFNISYYL